MAFGYGTGAAAVREQALCRHDGIGRRLGLKIPWVIPCGFKSRCRHHDPAGQVAAHGCTACDLGSSPGGWSIKKKITGDNDLPGVRNPGFRGVLEARFPQCAGSLPSVVALKSAEPDGTQTDSNCDTTESNADKSIMRGRHGAGQQTLRAEKLHSVSGDVAEWFMAAVC